MQQALQASHTLVHVARKETWDEAEKLRGERCECLIAAQFGHAANEMETADRLLAVVANVVEYH